MKPLTVRTLYCIESFPIFLNFTELIEDFTSSIGIECKNIRVCRPLGISHTSQPYFSGVHN